MSVSPSASGATSDGVRSVVLRSGVYADSVRLMQVTRDVSALPRVTGVLVAIAPPLNLELGAVVGLAAAGGDTPGQLLVAVRAAGGEALAAATSAVGAALTARERSRGAAAAVPLRSIGAGLDQL